MSRWWKEFKEFFFSKGNALSLAIALVVGQQFTKIVDSLSRDLLLPLLNPFIPHGSYKDLAIPYFGGAIEVGKLLDTFVEGMLVAWALFVILQAVKRVERIGNNQNPGSPEN